MKFIQVSNLANDFLQLTINNPDNLNALSEAVADEFAQVCRELVFKQTKARALVIRGQGKAFSAGGDLQMLLAKTDFHPQKNRELMLKFYNSFLSILDLPFPVVAAINGTAIGAGLILACACDLRVAASDAKMGFGFIKLGLHPGLGSTYFVPRLIGVARTTELFLSSRIFDSQYAEQIGLINQVLDANSFDTELISFLNQNFAGSPQASAQLVETLRPTRSDLHKILEREAFCQSVNYSSEEFKEGVTAMLEKRKAKFSL
jgi:enoyl-CoA hydratase/carnithine racemase